ncbi:CmpA/NrtA family ABC transporter substrate-binding protein [Nitratireductor sp. XY-223]|uniref:CmpA/NrtA family ABC transporter substrate-binding protein n=1 Tax=Nitratireductor sp. XY-223 TaxID=2561926 RepID=UPI0010AA760D|nr:CmpA/NrtA family ABC transporter substrate-binding protein [Nitratireductor sp. XY-223]
MTDVTAAFLPLTDSAILVAARECGFAEDEGIVLSLLRETSWANVRDRMAIGQFEAAHMLAPMPIAFALGLTPLSLDVIAPMSLGLGGNAVTVSRWLYDLMQQARPFEPADAANAGTALRMVARNGRRRLQLAVVHPHSGHNLELRYWLAASGIAPDRDVDIVFVPPPYMPDALASGQIDGFCVGEPWNSVAVKAGDSVVATTKSAIWKSSPEKVLGVRADWAERNGEALDGLLRALYRAARWCGEPENFDALAALLSRDDYIGKPAGLILRALNGSVAAPAKPDQSGFYEPFARAATFPWQSHALWFYSQMVRWGQVEHSRARAVAAARCFRPDLYRAAIESLSVPIPAANAKVEGAMITAQPVGSTHGTLVLGPDGFFDGRTFDPDRLDAYLSEQSGNPGKADETV